MTEEQAFTIFVCEPIIFVMMLFIVIYAYDKLYPCRDGERDSTGRHPHKPVPEDKPKTRPYRKSPDMLDENNE